MSRGRSGPALFEKLVMKVAKKWVAGNAISDAMRSAKEANAAGMDVIINYLGEHSESLEEIGANVKEYIAILDEMNKRGIDGSISPKLTQVGLDRDSSTCAENLSRMAERARKTNRFVWVDMESFSYLDDTIEIYLTLLKQYQNIGIAFQAYLKEGAVYLMRILEHSGKVRLVKGAYREDAKIAYRSRAAVDKNYAKLMRILFRHGNEFAIATHDEKMINEAVKLSKKFPAKKFEFQMLRGIRDDIKSSLVGQGFRLAEYIPYGGNVTPYSIRRIKERPANILLLARSLLG